MTEQATTPDLVGEHNRALVGTELLRHTAVLHRADFQRWALAVGDDNPLYFDADHARAHGYRDVVMPPLYLPNIGQSTPPREELAEDGMPTRGAVYAEVRFPGCTRRMAAGLQMVFHEPLHDGDAITAAAVVTSIEQKRGRSGDFVVMAWTTTYTRGDGVVVAEETRSLISRP